MFKDVKNALRISGRDLDNEVLDLIESAKADLALSGVHKDKISDIYDPLIKRAVIIYCKANFGYDDPKLSERFQESYTSLKQHLTLSSEYTTAGDDE
ncbi:MAG: DNA-packaging protein [Bacteroidales bacterium]|nr:DNA-packaging protein [Bacteroidales bacterium]